MTGDGRTAALPGERGLSTGSGALTASRERRGSASRGIDIERTIPDRRTSCTWTLVDLNVTDAQHTQERAAPTAASTAIAATPAGRAAAQPGPERCRGATQQVYAGPACQLLDKRLRCWTSSRRPAALTGTTWRSHPPGAGSLPGHQRSSTSRPSSRTTQCGASASAL